VTEAEVVTEITRRADDRALLWHHCPDSRRCRGPRGFPDLFVAGPHGAFVAEVKSADGESSAEQDLWHWTIERGRGGDQCPWHQLRPEDLENGTVDELLDAIA
jgi:hypothetical protein